MQALTFSKSVKLDATALLWHSYIRSHLLFTDIFQYLEKGLLVTTVQDNWCRTCLLRGDKKPPPNVSDVDQLSLSPRNMRLFNLCKAKSPESYRHFTCKSSLSFDQTCALLKSPDSQTIRYHQVGKILKLKRCKLLLVLWMGAFTRRLARLSTCMQLLAATPHPPNKKGQAQFITYTMLCTKEASPYMDVREGGCGHTYLPFRAPTVLQSL